MKIESLIGFSLIILFLTVGCSGKRPCGDICLRSEEDPSKHGFIDQEVSLTLSEIIQKHVDTKIEQANFIGEEPVENVISLSAGGQYGAFGAGFTVGWYELGAQSNDPLVHMPEFDIVSSVSTGSLLAPFVFLLSGKIDNDEPPIPGEKTREERMKEEINNLLIEVYSEGLKDSDVVKGWWASNLFTKKALYSRAPLRKLLQQKLKDEYLQEIANQDKKNRLLLIGSVNLDTGKFTIINLTQVASDYAGEVRQEIFIDTLMASSAIPVIFPVEFLNGEMYIDGGAREYVFFRDIEKDINDRYLAQGIAEVDKTFYMIVHGDYRLDEQCTPKSPIDIALRSMSVVLDHNLRVSVFYNAYLANNPIDPDTGEIRAGEPSAWNIKVLSAKDHNCEPGETKSKLFDPTFTRCLYDLGQELGSDPKKKWIEDIKDLARLVDESQRAKILTPTPPRGFSMCKP